MGSRGANSGRTGSVKTGASQFEGKSVTELQNITWMNMEEKLGLENLSDGQQKAITRILRGVQEYDYTYSDDGRTPAKIVSIDFKQPMKNGTDLLKPDYYVSFSITTEGNTGNKYTDMLDRKYRSGAIGRKGGIFTYNSKGKKVSNENEAIVGRYGWQI